MNHALAEVFASVGIQLACRVEVFGKVQGLKLRVRRLTHIIVGKLTSGIHGSAQQSAAEGAVSEGGDAMFVGVRQNVGFYPALKEIVGRLNRVKRRDRSE